MSAMIRLEQHWPEDISQSCKQTNGMGSNDTKTQEQDKKADTSKRDKPSVEDNHKNDNIQEHEASKMKDLAMSCYFAGDYYVTRKLLDKMRDGRNDQDLDNLLLRAECDYYLDDDCTTAVKCCEVAVQSPELDWTDYLRWGKGLYSMRRYLAAILLYDVAKEKCRLNDRYSKEYTTVAGDCALLIGVSACQMALCGGKLRKIAKTFVYESILKPTHKAIRDMQYNNEQLSAEIRCVHGMGICDYGLDKKMKAIGMFEYANEKLSMMSNHNHRFQTYCGAMEVLSGIYADSRLYEDAIDATNELIGAYEEEGSVYMNKSSLKAKIRGLHRKLLAICKEKERKEKTSQKARFG